MLQSMDSESWKPLLQLSDMKMCLKGTNMIKELDDKQRVAFGIMHGYNDDDDFSAALDAMLSSDSD